MFSECPEFDCDLSNWNISKVTSMRHMFEECENFKGKGLEKWNVSNVNYMNYIFDGCTSLKNKPTWYKE